MATTAVVLCVTPAVVYPEKKKRKIAQPFSSCHEKENMCCLFCTRGKNTIRFDPATLLLTATERREPLCPIGQHQATHHRHLSGCQTR